MQGGHELLHLATNKIITQRAFMPVLMTDSVIKHIELLAKADNITSLKFENKNRTTTYDTDWLAGVDTTAKNHYDYTSETTEEHEDEGSIDSIDLN